MKKWAKKVIFFTEKQVIECGECNSLFGQKTFKQSGNWVGQANLVKQSGFKANMTIAMHDEKDDGDDGDNGDDDGDKGDYGDDDDDDLNLALLGQ